VNGGGSIKGERRLLGVVGGEARRKMQERQGDKKTKRVSKQWGTLKKLYNDVTRTRNGTR